jgi:hypothetical protein
MPGVTDGPVYHVLLMKYLIPPEASMDAYPHPTEKASLALAM